VKNFRDTFSSITQYWSVTLTDRQQSYRTVVDHGSATCRYGAAGLWWR